MAFVNVEVQWRRGVSGTDGTYVFSPNPTLTRSIPGKRTAIHVVPLMDGVLVQNLALQDRTIGLEGVLFNKTNSWDDMETARQNLIEGIGTGPGQLHIISPQRHIYYSGQIVQEGIMFDSQPRSNFQAYATRILVADGAQHNVIATSKTTYSNARIA